MQNWDARSRIRGARVKHFMRVLPFRSVRPNTYLIEADEGFVVLDPGPEDTGHLDDIIAATDGNVRAILLSHMHSDHLGATSSLKARTGHRPLPSIG